MSKEVKLTEEELKKLKRSNRFFKQSEVSFRKPRGSKARVLWSNKCFDPKV